MRAGARDGKFGGVQGGIVDGPLFGSSCPALHSIGVY